MGGPYRIRKGETFTVVAASSVVCTLTGAFRVEYDGASDYDDVRMNALVTGAARAVEAMVSDWIARKDGLVVEGLIALGGDTAATPKRGQTYVQAVITSGTRQWSNQVITAGYVYGMHAPTLGEIVEPGPGGGEGFLSWVTHFHNAAGDAVETEFTLAATNAFRKVYGVAYFYHSDGTVATRTMFSPLLENIGGTAPTNFTTTGANAHSYTAGTDVTLTQDQEGYIKSVGVEGKDGQSVSVDNGTLSVESAASDPTPWPVLATESENGRIRFRAVTNGVATDTQSAYVLVEEWVVL